MTQFLQIAISNALLATLAAPLVWLIGRVVGRPALTHMLWLIVLVKLLTPPIWTIPVVMPVSWPGLLQPRTDLIASRQAAQAPHLTAREAPLQSDPRIDGFSSASETVIESVSVMPPAVATITPVRSDPRAWLLRSIGSAWLAGAVMCLFLAITRLVRFSRTLRHAIRVGDDVQFRADALARRMGLSAAPAVWFIPGALCPMLWTLGDRARVLIPRELWTRLEPEQRDAILLHEIAHWRRCDHWVRWLELAATTLYWWHPVCWWTRHELREAEEQCCDAWVMSLMPGAFRNYASALLEAVDFISIRAGASPAVKAVPALASGMGQFGHLKRRLTMLKQGNVARALSWGGLATVLGAAALLLPISASIAQQSPKDPTHSDTITITRSATVVADDLRRVDGDIALDNTNANGNTNTLPDDPAQDPRQAARELREAQEKIERLSKELAEAQARLAVLMKTANPDWNSNGTRAPGELRRDNINSAPGAGYARRNVAASHAQVDRLDRIEAQLQSLLKEVREIRDQISPSGNKDTSGYPYSQPRRM